MGKAKRIGRPNPKLEIDTSTASGRFAVRIREMRGDRTLDDVAAEIGVSANTLWNWEHGRGLALLDKLESLAVSGGKTLSGLLRS